MKKFKYLEKLNKLKKLKWPNLEVSIISAIILTVVVITTAIGIIAYDRLSNIAKTLVEESRPDLKLVVLKGILFDLSKAESQIKSYTISKEDKYLETYYYTISEIDDKIDALRNISDTLSLTSKSKIDSIALLIEKKFSVWDEMIEVSQNDQLSNVFSQIKARIEYKKQRAALESRLDELERQKNQEKNEEDEGEEEIKEDKPEPVAESETEDKSNIFKRLFGKKVKDINSAAGDSAETVEEKAKKIEAQHKKNQEKDSVNFSEVKINKPELKVNPREDIQKDIARIQRREGMVRSQNRERELEILAKDKVISNRIQLLIADLEKIEMNEFEQRALVVDEQASKTNTIIIVFCVAISVLLFLVFFLMGRYVKQTNDHQRVLKKARKDAENLAEAKEMFIANMSHEIRTPMNSIIGFTEQALLKEKNKEQSELLHIVQRSSEHLLKVINDILDFSKLKTKKLSIQNEEFSPGELINEVFVMLKIQAEKKDLRFDCRIIPGLPHKLSGDPDRLKQVLINIIGNAIKFTEEGMVTVAVGGSAQEGDDYLLEIKVSDTGIGIPKNRLENIFEDFTQAEMSTHKKYGGTGLGLAISKNLVEQQRGSIEVSSEEHIGSVFRICIPYKVIELKSTGKKAVKKKIEEFNLEGMNFLIVDDAKYNRILLKTILRNWKGKFKEAENGEEALERMKEEEFDVILMDARMPKMDGYETTKYIRNTLKSDVPVIALTAAIAHEDIQKCKEAGMNEYISKPFTEQQLKDVLVKYSTIVKKKDPEKKSRQEAKEMKSVLPANGRINMKQLNDLAQGEDAFVIEMLEIFVNSTNAGMKEIKAAVKEENWKKVGDQAHKIAAPCRHMEAMDLLKIIKDIEKLSGSKPNVKKMTELIKKLESEGEQILQIVEEELSAIKSK